PTGGSALPGGGNFLLTPGDPGLEDSFEKIDRAIEACRQLAEETPAARTSAREAGDARERPEQVEPDEEEFITVDDVSPEDLGIDAKATRDEAPRAKVVEGMTTIDGECGPVMARSTRDDVGKPFSSGGGKGSGNGNGT